MREQKENLQEMVQKYQQGDYAAAEQLRQQFAPLIYKLSHRQSMYSIFGEDAENMAWLLFYEFIFNYKGCDFVRLPGLVRRFLIFRLMRFMEQQGMRWDTEVDLENETICGIGYECEQLQRFLNNKALQEEILRLPESDRLLLEEYYFNCKTQEEIARSFNCTSRSVRKYQKYALKRLKRRLEK